MSSYTHYTDGGHGWIAVGLNELAELGIENKVSRYSYRQGRLAYLEEDCDASLWFEAYQKKHGCKPELVGVFHGRNSPIRNMQHYTERECIT